MAIKNPIVIQVMGLTRGNLGDMGLTSDWGSLLRFEVVAPLTVIDSLDRELRQLRSSNTSEAASVLKREIESNDRLARVMFQIKIWDNNLKRPLGLGSAINLLMQFYLERRVVAVHPDPALVVYRRLMRSRRTL